MYVSNDKQVLSQLHLSDSNDSSRMKMGVWFVRLLAKSVFVGLLLFCLFFWMERCIGVANNKTGQQRAIYMCVRAGPLPKHKTREQDTTIYIVFLAHFVTYFEWAFQYSRACRRGELGWSYCYYEWPWLHLLWLLLLLVESIRVVQWPGFSRSVCVVPIDSVSIDTIGRHEQSSNTYKALHFVDIVSRFVKF